MPTTQVTTLNETPTRNIRFMATSTAITVT